MTISFPRDLPEFSGRLLFSQADFDPFYQQTMSPSRGGQVQVANLGPDLWSMSFATDPISYQTGLEYMAWIQSLRGGARLFKAWHPLRRYPYAYPNGFAALTRAGGGAFDGTCTLNAIATERDTITLTTLPASFQFNIGDMVSFPMLSGATRALVRVLEAATANGSGVATLAIEPTIPLAATTGVTATLVKPWCLAVIDAKSIKGPMRPGMFQSVSFSALQTY